MHVFIIAAMTADGFIACDSNHLSTDWTSPEDKKWFYRRTKEAGVVVMGSKTYLTVGRPMPGRLNLVYSRNPNLVPAMKEGETELRVIDTPPAELIKQLEAEGHKELAICGGSHIHSLFIKAGVVNALYLTVEPVLFGAGVPLFSEPIDQTRLTLKSTQQLNSNALLLEYSIKN